MTDVSKDAGQPTTNSVDPTPADPAPADGGRRRAGGETSVRSTGEKERSTGEKMKAGSNAVRSKLASLVWLVAVVCALFLAVGALLIALNANRDNEIVTFVLDGARLLEGPFEDLFTFHGENAATKAALVNWGIAAVVYLIIGKILDRIIRP
ncbi:MAG: hypothetical protein ACRDPJ_10335 [Nocardioidaceae bacterium]